MVSSSQQLPYLLSQRLNLWSGDGCNRGKEGRQIEIGRRVRIESIYIDGAPGIVVGHGVLAISGRLCVVVGRLCGVVVEYAGAVSLEGRRDGRGVVRTRNMLR